MSRNNLETLRTFCVVGQEEIATHDEGHYHSVHVLPLGEFVEGLENLAASTLPNSVAWEALVVDSND